MDPQVLSVPQARRVSLRVRNLSVAVKGQEKSSTAGRILDDVSFDIPAGSITAIMGGLGAGKTTLLNTLSQRVNVANKKMVFLGSVQYLREDTLPYIKHAYMLQTDSFLPGLSVHETLMSQAHLRMPRSVTAFEKEELVDTLLRVLELEHLRHVRIAKFGSLATTLSGGEQRRVSLAIQLLSRPAILFLDEPTTGLDTSSSLKLVEDLRKLASPVFGITIILSIHQPRTEIQALFDNICLLTRGGRVVYFGGLIDSAAYFASLRFISSDSQSSPENFVAYIMGLSVKDTSLLQLEKVTSHRIDMLVQSWRDHVRLDTDEIPNPDIFKQNLALFARDSKQSISLAREIAVLTKRTFVLTYRDIGSLCALNGGLILLAITVGWMFYKPYPDLSGIRSLTSVLYVMLELVGFCPMFFEIERLWAVDGVFFRREYLEHFVSVPGFLISRRLGKFFLEDGPMAFFFSLITFFMWGLRTNESSGGLSLGHVYGLYFTLTLLTNLTAMLLALLAFSLSPDFAISTVIINIYYQVQNSACGYFVNAKTMPVYVRWTKYLAYFWAGFGALTATQFSDWHGACPYAADDSRCVQYLGNYQLQVLGYPVRWIAEPIGIMLGWFFGFFILTGIVLYYKKFEILVPKTKKNTIGGEEDPDIEESHDSSLIEFKNSDHRDVAMPNEKPLRLPSPTANPTKDGLTANDEIPCSSKQDIGISIRDISLDVVTTAFFSRKKTEATLLDHISADFAPNTINVIMGPSGLGKTTLLNFLSLRFSRALTFKISGHTFLNKLQPVEMQTLARMLAYVLQHDNALLPQLTVRETLYFQARLRLPLCEHEKIPAIVNTLIRKTGLADCAETLVGLEFMKGISGGEKRRVSIAVQLLSRPKILFLDEPTSGLDSTTAVTILELLATVARENHTTIILTIHQPEQQLFNSFGLLLLLARGGKTIYNGNASGIEPYLALRGYTCPPNINIADYMLDLVSRVPDEEDASYELRVNSLVSWWSLLQVKEAMPPTIAAMNATSTDLVANHIETKAYFRKQLPMRTTIPVVLRRQAVNLLRSNDVIFSRMGQTILLGIVHALYFSPLRNGSSGVSNRLGLVQAVLNLYFVGLINNITLYPVERNLFYQEYHDGIYGVFEFTTLYLVNELPFEIFPCFFFTAMIVMVVGLPRNAGMFFGMFASSFVLVNCGELIGMFVNSCFNHLGVATNVVTNIATLAVFMGGTMSLQMPNFFKGINYINPLRYVVGITTVLTFENQKFNCGLEDCTLSTGADVLNSYGLGHVLGECFAGLFACLVAYRLVAVALVYVRVKWFL